MAIADFEAERPQNVDAFGKGGGAVGESWGVGRVDSEGEGGGEEGESPEKEQTESERVHCEWSGLVLLMSALLISVGHSSR